jgi:hypothetical protein
MRYSIGSGLFDWRPFAANQKICPSPCPLCLGGENLIALLSHFLAVLLQPGALDQNIPQTVSHVRVSNLLKHTLQLSHRFFIERFPMPGIVFHAGRTGRGNLSHAETDILKERFAEERVYLLEEPRFKELKLLDPRRMGDIHEKDTISDRTGLRLIGQGFADNLPPRAPDGIGLQLSIDLEAFQGALEDRTNRLGFAFTGHF